MIAKFLFVLVSAFAVLLCCPAVAQMDAIARESVVILRNGNVLRGRVIPAGDQYLVSPQFGGQIVVPRTEVEMISPSLLDAYFQKRDRIEHSSVKNHLGLGEWCLRHKLIPQAADQMLAAFALDPRNKQIAGFEQRLILEVNSDNSNTTPKPPVRVASPNASDGDNLVGAIPAASMERFVNLIQPYVLNRCGANSCHGVSTSADLKLVRARDGETMSAKFTRRNLSALLKRIDRVDPKASVLLTTVVAPHANTGPLLTENDRIYERIVDWISSLSAVESNAQVDVRGTNGSIRDGRNVIFDPAVRPTSSQNPVDRELKQRIPMSPRPRTTRSIDDRETPNPLDPERFNSQYLDDN